MLKSYCQKCGALNAYISERPNFCQKCGNNFGVGAVDQNELKPELDEVAGAEVVSNIPQIGGLDIEIDVRGPNVDKVGDLAHTAEQGEIPAESSQEVKIEDYNIKEAFKKEASTLRPNNEKGKKET